MLANGSQRDTAFHVSASGRPFTPQESFTYNTLGLVSDLNYPVCTHSGCTPAAPVFADVPASHPDQREIEAIYQAGVTAGCNTNPLQYCPGSN